MVTSVCGARSSRFLHHCLHGCCTVRVCLGPNSSSLSLRAADFIRCILHSYCIPSYRPNAAPISHCRGNLSLSLPLRYSTEVRTEVVTISSAWRVMQLQTTHYMYMYWVLTNEKFKIINNVHWLRELYTAEFLYKSYNIRRSHMYNQTWWGTTTLVWCLI